ncbi:MAG: UbiA-like polyprenyltransferase [Terrimicrobiaceae bacterium]|nr:UbiA-like polyprenyltransferase [Terrimicrobiaceae bacterium]
MAAGRGTHGRFIGEPAPLWQTRRRAAARAGAEQNPVEIGRRDYGVRVGGLSGFLQFIRFSHTIFALPFAIGAMFVAADGWPSFRVVAGILLAMVFARTAAMTFNRLADWNIDQRNPRTAGRHRLMSRPAAAVVCAISAAGFVAAAAWLNPLCLMLSPVALAIVFFYSLTKRFTDFAQFFLGLALAVAPVGAWMAVTGGATIVPLVLAAAVLVWVAGFDLIYASQDYEVDRREGLHSLVVRLGVERAFRWAVGLHIAAFFGLAAFGWMAGLGLGYGAALVVIAGALIFEHREARRGTVESINRAFFQANAVVGIVFVLGIVADVFIR